MLLLIYHLFQRFSGETSAELYEIISRRPTVRFPTVTVPWSVGSRRIQGIDVKKKWIIKTKKFGRKIL